MKRVEEIDQQEQLLDLLAKRKEMLKCLISEKETALKSAPEGTLRVLKRPNGWQYYRRTDSKDTNGIYIPKKKQRTARALAQKGYDRKVLDLAKEELDVIKHYEDFLNTKSIKDLFALMKPGRKELITPVFVTDNEYIEAWRGEIYKPMGFEGDMSVYCSNGGVRLRSKSEIIIANMLEQFKVPYRYEYPITLKGIGTVRPDFMCLNIRTRKEFIWEHFGMMDNIAYANKNIAKINAYEQNGFYQGKNIIMTFETSQYAISSYVIKNMIEQYLL